MLPSSVGEDVNDTVCVTCFCPNKAIARHLCLECLLTKIDELQAAVNLTAMRGSSVNFSEEDSDKMSNTCTADFGGDLSSIGVSSSLGGDLSSNGVSGSIVAGNVVATLEGRIHNSVAHNPGIQSPLLSPRGGFSSVIQTAVNETVNDADTPLQGNRLFNTNEKEKKSKKKKKKKKKNNDISNLIDRYELKEATDEEKKEMLNHGKLSMYLHFIRHFIPNLLSFQLLLVYTNRKISKVIPPRTILANSLRSITKELFKNGTVTNVLDDPSLMRLMGAPNIDILQAGNDVTNSLVYKIFKAEYDKEVNDLYHENSLLPKGVQHLNYNLVGARKGPLKRYENKRASMPRGPDGEKPTLKDAASATGSEMLFKRYENKRASMPRGPDGKEPTLKDAASAIGRDIPSNLLRPNKNYNQEMILQQVRPEDNDFEKRHTKSPTGLLAILMNQKAIRNPNPNPIRDWIKKAKGSGNATKFAEKQFVTDAKKRTWRLTILEVGENAPSNARGVSEEDMEILKDMRATDAQRKAASKQKKKKSGSKSV
jgi:hypothetical protein